MVQLLSALQDQLDIIEIRKKSICGGVQVSVMDSRFITPANRNSEPFEDSEINQIKRYGEDFLDFLSVLKEFSCRRKKDRRAPGLLPFITIPTSVTKLLFHICSLFELPSEVKFVALEIFDSFNLHHFTDLWKHASQISGDPSAVKKYWHRISSRANKQTLLRAATSILIASKFAHQSSSITPRHVQKYLNECGHGYHLHSVFMSEVRVFSTLGCKVPLYSICDFTNTLLEGLQAWVDVDKLSLTCEKVLECTYLQREEIYLHYFWLATNRWQRTRKERFLFADIEVDNFLMAASVVVSSLYIHDIKGMGPNRASEILSELSGISSNDIRGLAINIAKIIFGNRMVKFTNCE